jgi:hypothetical protein
MDSMTLSRLQLLADTNLMYLAGNPLPGVGIIAGLSETGELVLAAWSFDPAVSASSLIVTTRHNREHGAVSNTADTSTLIADGFENDYSHQRSMHGVTYGKEPNFAPGISAACHWFKDEPVITMVIVRKSPFGDKCCRHLFEINGLANGFGHCLTEFRGGGDPLPPFRGEPFLVPVLGGDVDCVSKFFSQKLNPPSLAVKCIAK